MKSRREGLSQFTKHRLFCCRQILIIMIILISNDSQKSGISHLIGLIKLCNSLILLTSILILILLHYSHQFISSFHVTNLFFNFLSRRSKIDKISLCRPRFLMYQTNIHTERGWKMIQFFFRLIYMGRNEDEKKFIVSKTERWEKQRIKKRTSLRQDRSLENYETVEPWNEI